ncbi:cupin domain-containing protein [uncultured Shewanella sp.]|uniref:cupin domain-containing protein n=1 Tax=uncultured Shewanella sp. TaxID=173975 RepID=UPI00260D2D09|nr:cupin domain-containing protein [uncultured Shewanella sp.]
MNKAVVHATVDEFWYVLKGQGEIWRNNGLKSKVTKLVAGTAIDIASGTVFQYRNIANEELTFLCITMPSWPNDTEASYVDNGKWIPTV